MIERGAVSELVVQELCVAAAACQGNAVLDGGHPAALGAGELLGSLSVMLATSSSEQEVLQIVSWADGGMLVQMAPAGCGKSGSS